MKKVSKFFQDINLAEHVLPDANNDIILANCVFKTKNKLELKLISHLNIQDSYGNDLTHYAALRNQLSLLLYLESRGLNLDRPNIHGLTPLHLALMTESQQATTFLIKRGANLEQVFNLPKPDQELFFAPSSLVKKIVNRSLSMCEQPELSAIQLAAYNLDRVALKQMFLAKSNLSSNMNGEDLGSFLLREDREIFRSYLEHLNLNKLFDIWKEIDCDERIKLSGKVRESLNNSESIIKTELSQDLSETLNRGDFLHLVLKTKINQLFCSKTEPLIEHFCKSNCDGVQALYYLKELYNNFRIIEDQLIDRFPASKPILHDLVHQGRIVNKRFGEVILYILATIGEILPDEDPMQSGAFIPILENTIKEQQRLKLSWAEYVSQKILANNYKISGLGDLFNEYRNSIIFPCLVNKLLETGQDISAIMENSKSLDRIASKITLEQIIQDKSLGSLFRFNTLWHRADMRLPESACPDLELIGWAQIIPGGVWQMDSTFKIVELNSGKKLEIEGQEMHHCVRSRTGSCVDGRSHIFSIKENNSSIATIEIRLDKSSSGHVALEVTEMKGPGNAPCSQAAKNVWSNFISKYNNGDISLNFSALGASKDEQQYFTPLMNNYLAKTYVRPGRHPIGAINHYAELKIWMNRTNEVKFLFGAFRSKDFRPHQILKDAIEHNTEAA